MRQRLLDASSVVFPRLGYHDTRVDDVVEEAGASHGSFYRYFENKEDLFRVIAGEAASGLIARIGSFPRDGDPDALRTWLEDWFGAYAEHGAIIALWREMEPVDPILDDVTRRVAEAALGGLVDALDRSGTGDPLVNAIAFLALIETVPHHVHGLGYFERNDAVEAMVAIIRRGFLGLDVAA
jgi:AcrR family transcriptional regulator